MYCSKCGKEINDNANFCKHCGFKTNIKQGIEEDITNINTMSSENTNIKTKKIVYTVLWVIICIGIAVFIIHDKAVENYRSSHITTSDMKRMIESQYISNITNVDSTYKCIEDGYGRMLATFTYQAYDYNKQPSYYTDTMTFMVMKKNNKVTYSRRPDYYVALSVYRDDEDFKKQNFWGQAESFGLSKAYSKSFFSTY